MDVVFLLLPSVNLLDLSGPAQVFSAAATLGADYRLRWAGSSGDVVSAQHLTLTELEPLSDVVPDADSVVVVPGPDLAAVGRHANRGELVPPDVLEWTRRAAAGGARVASVCTGAVVLGDAGLLDGRRCTTHWSAIAAMRERYPAAHVVDDVLFVHDGPVSTSAGIASGIDLALSVVEADHGPAFAASVARELVVYARRNGSSSPLSPFLAHRDHLDPVVHAVQDTLAADLAGSHPLAELAQRAHLSPRGLSRAFVAATGLTPAQYQTELRLGHARTLLRGSALSVEEIARACGYADPRHFRRMFGAHEGVSPSAFRAVAA